MSKSVQPIKASLVVYMPLCMCSGMFVCLCVKETQWLVQASTSMTLQVIAEYSEILRVVMRAVLVQPGFPLEPFAYQSTYLTAFAVQPT